MPIALGCGFVRNQFLQYHSGNDWAWRQPWTKLHRPRRLCSADIPSELECGFLLAQLHQSSPRFKGVTVNIPGKPSGDGSQGGPLTRRRHPLQRWLFHVVVVLHRWAESGHARTATATWGFVQSSFILGPPDALLLPLGLADPKRVFSFAFWTTVGSVFGALTAFFIGVFAFETLGIPLFRLIGVGPDTIQHARALFAEHTLLMVLASALGLLPVPANVMSMVFGGFGVPLIAFAPVFLFGRSARFFVVALIIRFAGSKLLGWIERRAGRPFAVLR